MSKSLKLTPSGTTSSVGLHIDYAGPYQGHMFLVVIDSHTKWLEVFPTTSFHTIEKLRMLFSSFDLPHKIVSDSGSVFTSQEFQDFMKSNGIIYVKVSPYHPSSNGLAERAVHIFKRGLEKQTEGSLKCKISKVLFNYRVTPQSTTAKSPMELYLGQKLKSRLDLLHLDLQGKVEFIKWRNRVNLMIDIVDSESSKKTLCLLETIELVQNG